MKTRIMLEKKDIPTRWYNILADMPHPPAPPLHPATGEPINPDDLSPLFPRELILQEVSGERWVDIPEEVLEVYALWRPTPLCRARRFEEALQTPARIYYKYEGVSPPGSHKPNTAVAQAYYNQKEGVKRLCTETGAGQWGSALSFACHLFGLACTVYMVRVSYQQKPYRRTMMRTWGAEVIPSPSDRTAYGCRALAADPDSPGSLGMAISEAVEDAASRGDTKYSLGSVLNHVLLHQTVIGLETQKQMALTGEYPDVVIGCHGGGSNFAGLALPFIREKLRGREIRVMAVEPSACPSLTRGRFAYDFGDTAGLTPLMKMYTIGHGFVPPGIHAGGLRYHGAAPIVSQLLADGLIEARACDQFGVFESAVAFARAEGIIAAPEAAHAIKAAADEAILAREEGKEKTILFNLSGHGYFDMAAYDAYFDGVLEDHPYPERELAEAMRKLPAVGS